MIWCRRPGEHGPCNVGFFDKVVKGQKKRGIRGQHCARPTSVDDKSFAVPLDCYL